MIPVSATIVAFGTIDDGVPGGTDAEWGVPAISPGTQAEDSTLYRGWKQLWIENGTDARLDVGIITTVTTNASATILAAAKQRILSLAAGEKFSWDFGSDRLSGPIYLRGTTADPTTGNAYLGGMAE